MARDDNQNDLQLFRYRFAGAEFDEARGDLRVDGVPVPLEPRPLALLQALLEQAQQVVSHEELLARLWGRAPEHLSDNVLANAVSKLRKALGSETGALIRSVTGHGYVLETRPERIAVGRRFASAQELKPGAEVPGRPAYVLEVPLGSPSRNEAWLARHAKTHHHRVFKFCRDGEGLAALKREFTLYRVLRESLGERDDFAVVVDANFANDPYFLECEYGGENLAAWAAHPSRLAQMPLAARLEMFIGIARAVADAHGVGVLHKDLKPSNVLVAPAAARAHSDNGGTGPERWITRLTDFGSGRLLTPERLKALGVTQLGLTMTHDVVADSGSGTLLYLAPEVLAGGAPTVQSDLYALGLMLYQLLAGDLRKPMVTGWEADITDPLLRDNIAAATYGRLDLRSASVATWVERLTTLEQRRAAAQQDAEAAERAEAAARTLRAARARRPWLVALALVLVAGLAATTWQWRQPANEREQAESASRRATAIQAFLRDDVLGGSNPFAARAAEPTTVRQAILDAATKVDSRFDAYPATEAEVRYALARLMAQYQDYAAAQAQWTLALPLLESAFGANDVRTRKARYLQAGLFARQGQANEAAAALARADAALPAAADDPELAVIRPLTRGEVMVHAQRNTDALPHLEQALIVAKATPALDTAVLDSCYSFLTAALYVAGRVDRVVVLAKEWLEAIKRRADASALSLAYAEQRLAEGLMYVDRQAEAEPLIRHATDVFTRALGPTSAVTAMARSSYCTLLQQQEHQAAAIDCFVELHRSTLNARDLPAWWAWAALGNAGIMQFLIDQTAQASASFEKAIPPLQRIAGAEGYANSMSFYWARTLQTQGRDKEAMNLLEGIRADTLARMEPDEPWDLRLQLLEGVLRAKLGETQRARALLGPALEAAPKKSESLEENLVAQAQAAFAKLPSSGGL
jgi:eukaryotic-like serine/threonine-protein kinase